VGGPERVGGREAVRLFLALELPDEARSALCSWREPALSGSPALRPVASEDLHATLCFLGSRRAEEIHPILEACAGLAPRPAPALALGRPLWLPRQRPRVLAVSLEDASGALAAVQSELSERMAAGGWYTPERRPYLAHVSVARLRAGGAAARGVPETPRLGFTAPRVTLYRSHLSAAGARYEALGAVELGAGAREVTAPS